MKSTNHKRPRGFTLVELLLVISIITILASMTMVGIGVVMNNVKKAVAETRFQEIVSAIELCKNDNGYYPAFAIEPSASGDLIFPKAGGQDDDWTDFWKTMYALKSPEESGSNDYEKLDSAEARELGNPRRKQYLKPSDDNHHRDRAGKMDWSTIKGMYKNKKKKDRERLFVVIDLDGDGKFENPDPRTREKYEHINQSVGFYSQEIKGDDGEGKILFKTWPDLK